MPHEIALPQTLITARLAGRPPRPLDVPFLRLILQDAQAMRWLAPDGRPVPDARVEWLLQRLISHWTAHDFGVRLFFLRDGDGRIPETDLEPRDSFAGWCGLRHQLIDGRPEIELLYALRPALWRRGLGTEMARACLDEGFSGIGLTSVVAFTLPDNRASRGVMEACGMAETGAITHAGLPHVLYRVSSTGSARAMDSGTTPAQTGKA